MTAKRRTPAGVTKDDVVAALRLTDAARLSDEALVALEQLDAEAQHTFATTLVELDAEARATFAALDGLLPDL